VNALATASCVVGSTCDGVVTGIQRRALASDIDVYRSIKKPQ
jgi:hypothetical protein